MNRTHIIALCTMSILIGSLYSSECFIKKDLILDTIPCTRDDIDRGNYALFSYIDQKKGIHFHFLSQMQNIHKFVKIPKPGVLDYSEENIQSISYYLNKKTHKITIFLTSLDNKLKLPLYPKDPLSEHMFLKLVRSITASCDL